MCKYVMFEPSDAPCKASRHQGVTRCIVCQGGWDPQGVLQTVEMPHVFNLPSALLPHMSPFYGLAALDLLCWVSQAVTRKTRILEVVYNASNNELVSVRHFLTLT